MGLVTIPYRIPAIKAVLNTCAGGKLISELDLKGAFLQFPLAEQSREKLFLRHESEIYEVATGMFGMSNLTDHCQRVMAQLLREEQEAIPYVDNVVVATERDFQAHAEVVVRVVDRCTKYNVWFNIERSLEQLLVTEITLLGHRVDEKGTSLDPTKVAAVESWVLPKTQADLSRFLGFCGFLRGNIRHYNDLTAPLHDIQESGKLTLVRWTKESEAAFLNLKKAIATAPRVGYIDWDKAVSLAIDASARGVGAVLYQPKQPSDPPTADTVISFTSRALLKHERNYAPYKLELLGLVNALVVFEHILAGIEFTVLTDHRALTFLLTQAGTNRTLGNWLSLLLEFRFKVIHLPGFENEVADFLSRAYTDRWGVAAEIGDDKNTELPQDWVRAESITLGAMRTRAKERVHLHLTEERKRAPTSSIVSPGAASPLTPDPSRADPISSPALHPTPSISPDVISPARVDTAVQLAGVSRAIHLDHQQKVADAHSFGHFGVTATIARLKLAGEEWPGMRDMVERVLQNCKPCQAWTQGKHRFAPLLDTSKSVRLPWQQVQIDLLTSLGVTSEGWRYVLVWVDVLSDFVILRALKTKSATEIAEIMWKIFCDFGPPKVICSDNEITLISQALKQVTETHGVEHRTIAQYNSRALGACEREVGVALITINKLLTQCGGDWYSLLPFTQLAMNTRAQERSGSLPFELLFNRQMNEFQSYLPLAGLSEVNSGAWVEHQRKVYSVLFPVVAEKVAASKARSRDRFDDKKLTAPRLDVGHIVMLDDRHNQGTKGHAPYIGPYEVVGLAAKDVYYIQDSTGRKLERPVPVDQLKLLPKATRKWLPPPEVDEGTLAPDQFMVDKLLGHRVVKGKHQYKVLWKGFEEEQASWEDVADIDQSLVRDYMRTATRVPPRRR